MANNGVYYSSGHSLNFTTSSTTWATLTSGGTFEMNAVSATTYYNLPSATFTGGTVSGATIFTGGLSANTISATTYYNLPISAITNGTGISASTNNGTVNITNTSPDQTVTITGGTNIQIAGTYPNFGVNFTGSTSGDYLPLSGGTVTGATIFQSGLTANTFYTNYIDFNTSSTPVNNEGRLIWNNADEIGGLEVTMMSGNTVLQIGEENLARVYNADSVTLTAGTVVYVFGSQGNTISVKRASSTGETTSSRALGVVSESIAVGERGFVNTFGLVKGLNTLAYSGGTPIWLGTTPGSWTSTEPDAPNHTVLIGFISRSANSPNGSLFVHINNGWELNELHNVYAPSPSNGDILKYSAATSVWVNSNTLNLNSISATTISATTYYGNGSNLTGIPKGGGGSGQVYYFNISSAQTPYYEFSTTPTGNAQQSLSASTGSTQTAYIGGFMTPSNTPYVTNFPAGIISFYIHSYTSDASATFNLYCELYKRTVLDVETLLFTSDPVIVAGTSTIMYVTDGFFTGATLNLDDRLVVKVYATNTSDQTRTITMLSEGSQHYSFSLTTLPTYPYGTGTSNQVTKWTSSTALGNSIIQDNGSFVGVGYGSPGVPNSTFGASIIESGIYQINGNGNSSLSITDTDYSTWTTGGNEIAIGTASPLGQSTGNNNVAIGSLGPLASNTGGYENVAIGSSPLHSNDTGYNNIAIGSSTLYSNVAGRNNIAMGYLAGYSTTGDSNVFIGPNAGYNETGSGKLYIANNSTTPLIYGDFNTNNVGIIGTLSATTYSNLPYSGTVTSITLSAGTSGNDFNISNPTITSSGTITLNIPNAGSASRGLVTTGSQTFAGVKTFSSAPNLNSLTASQILALDGSSNIQSLTTATYPSLAELSFVKGVTSAIQTQLNSKGTVTSVALSAGTSGTDVNISNSAVTTSGTITINIPDASDTARGLVTTGNQKFSGEKAFQSSPRLDSLTASQILALDGSSNIQSLSTTTYPSLTELSYVKGVTSAIQTQLNNKFNTSGGTVSGNLTVTGTTTSATISATTYNNLPGSSSANCFTTFFVTNISGCSPVNVLSPLNVKDGLSVTGTSTFTSQANFTGGISASTFSASTYQNLPSFNSVQINGTTQFSGNTNNYINFSGINITITSAATNTLVFSAGTGGGGGISGSGTTNYIPKFSGATGIGNSQLQDNGTQIFTNQGYAGPMTGNLSINASGTTGIAGRATQYGVWGQISGTTAFASGVYGEAGQGQYGVFGYNIGDTAGEYVGVRGSATEANGAYVGSVYIGGKFYGFNGTGAGYSVQLEDGTEGVGKFLKSITSDGKANWASLPVSEITAGTGISVSNVSGNVTIGVSLTSTQVFATATTTINAATYIDINGCSVSLAAGTWLITGHVVIAAANLIIQGFVAITTGANVVVAASALSRPASGTPSLNSPFAVSWSVLVSPAASTTYKLRAARGLTTHTSSYTVYNGTGFNTANHATDNSNLGTNILAIRIA